MSGYTITFTFTVAEDKTAEVISAIRAVRDIKQDTRPDRDIIIDYIAGSLDYEFAEDDVPLEFTIN